MIFWRNKSILVVTATFFLFLFLHSQDLFSATWKANAVRISDNDGSTSIVTRGKGWCVAARHDTIHVVWFDYMYGSDYEIIYDRSTDRGSTWDSKIRISSTSYNSRHPSIAISNEYVYIVWQECEGNDYEIFYRYSNNYGASGSWQTIQNITNDNDDQLFPVVKAKDPYVHVVYQDSVSSSDIDIKYLRSQNNGSTWDAEYTVRNTSEKSRRPCISSSGSKLDVTWDEHDVTNNDDDVFHVRNTNNGGSRNWGSIHNVTSDDNNNQYSASVTALATTSPEYLHVAYTTEESGTHTDIYYKRSTNGGTSWSTAQDIDAEGSTDAGQGNVSLASQDCYVNAVWEDSGHGSTAHTEIVYNYSQNNGSSWNSSQENVSKQTGAWYSLNPSIAATRKVSPPSALDRYLQVVWKDNRNTTYEVYWNEGTYDNS
jgi:hypothetical protein